VIVPTLAGGDAYTGRQRTLRAPASRRMTPATLATRRPMAAPYLDPGIVLEVSRRAAVLARRWA
jgi:hypothetical protein